MSNLNLTHEQKKKLKKIITDDYLFAKTFLKIYNKDIELIPLILKPEQRMVLEATDKYKLVVVIKARQLGISTAIQAKGFKKAITSTSRMYSLTHKDDSTQVFRRMQDTFYKFMPDGLRPQRGFANNTITTYPELGSEVSIGTAGGKGEGGRGFGGLSLIHASEAAFWANPEKLMAGLFQASPKCVVVESTANGAAGWFFETVMRLKESGYETEKERLFFFPWYREPTYKTELLFPDEIQIETEEEERLVRLFNLSLEQLKWRREKITEIGNVNIFRQEYPATIDEAFLKSEKGYFEDMTHCFNIPVGDVEPDSTHTYVAGLDWGQARDFTVLSIIDRSVTPYAQVDILRVNNMPWTEMRQRILDKLRKWNVKQLVAEANSMSANIENLRDDMKAVGIRTTLVPFDTSNASKLRIMSNLNEFMSRHQLDLLKHEVQRNELQSYTAKQNSLGTWTLEAPKGQHDDCVIALALSLEAAINNFRLTIGKAPKVLRDRR